MAEMIELHDRDKFETVAFAFGREPADAMRERLENAFDTFIDIADMSDARVAALTREMQIDIAIDLAGHTEGARTGIFARRAAPIQVNFLGYPGTMGAGYIDYLIADSTIVGPADDAFYVEKVVRLPHSYQVNDTQRKVGTHTFEREELGLPARAFVFCCFNNTFKILPGRFGLWMRILTHVKDSVLWLLEDNPIAAANLRKAAAQYGIDPGRLVFAPRMAQPEHLARQRAADLFLDTLPYGAHTTASDALWVDLPVLTRKGEAFAGRVAASLLTALALPELIATTDDDYVEKAIALGTNRQEMASLRQKLSQNKLTSPLFNPQLFARHIESAYLQMFERCQAGDPPARIDVGAIAE